MTTELLPALGEPATDALVPQRIGRYLFVEKLGAGAMGSVHAAYDPVLARTVAIKLLHDDRGDGHLRLLREAQAMAKLAHPHVIAVYDAGTLDGRVWLAMERVEGVTLRAWLASPRTTGEIVEVFAQAAEGLVAVHGVGIVHRDFKPDNVMVGERGGRPHVQVGDFGLAAGGEHDALLDAAAQSGASGSEALVDSGRMTRAGAVLGTPAYMAPEQFRGEDADARSDQFAFCVALFEAAFGARPFAGEHHRAIAMAVLHGEPSEPRPRDQLGRAIAAICRRGIARAPEQRWPSMAAVLGALRTLQGRRRRRVQIAAVGAAAVVVALAWWSRLAEVEPCTGAAARAGAVWSDARARGIEAAITADGRAWASGAAGWVRASIDDHVAAWIDQHGAACRATAIDGVQSPELLDLRMACLERRLAELDGIAEMLEHADAQVVARVHDVVAHLPALSACADADALRRGGATPPPELAEAVNAARRVLAGVRANVDAGAFARAEAGLAELEADAPDYPPLTLEADHERARILRERSRADAEPIFERVLLGAIELRDDALAIESGRELAFLVGVQLGRHAEARRTIALAQALRHGDDGDRTAVVLVHTRAQIEFAAGEYARARELVESALAGVEAGLPGAPLRGRMHNTAGAIALRAGRYADAREHLEASIIDLEGTLGAAHPELARSYNNLAIAHERQGDLPAAIAALERSREILGGTLGEGDAMVGQLLGNLATFHELAGQADAACAQGEQALGILERALGPDDPRLAAVLTAIGRAELARGRLDASARALDRSLSLRSAAMGADHPDLALPLVGRARLELAREHPELAERTTALALRVIAGHPFDPSDRGELWLVRADALTRLGRRDEAAAARGLAAGVLATAGPPGARLRGELARQLAHDHPVHGSGVEG